MTFVKFPESNVKLLPNGDEFSMNVESVEPLHVFSDGEQCISCFAPTPAELAALNAGARIWLHVLSGASQPPVSLGVGHTFSQRIKE